MPKLRAPFGAAVSDDHAAGRPDRAPCGGDPHRRAHPGPPDRVRLATPGSPRARPARLRTAWGTVVALLVGLAVLLAGAAPAAAEGDEDGFTFQDPRIVESSGLAASRAHPGVYWTHNDSGYDPTRIYAVDGSTGETVATLTLDGVEGRDLEAISVGPDGDVYVGDIGDNLDGSWSEVWIYRFPEPKELADATLTPTVHTVRYADGPRDAEALMVHPKTGRVYIASKSDEGDGGLYRGPERLVPSASGTNTFERIADLSLWVTDGAFSPDGTRLALRAYFAAAVHPWKDGALGRASEVRVPLQGQGESVTFTPDGRTLLFGSEGANSPVQPVKLSGEQLPESVPPEERESGTSGDSAGVTDDEKQRNLGRAGLVFVVAVVVVLALRRLFRRRAR